MSVNIIAVSLIDAARERIYTLTAMRNPPTTTDALITQILEHSAPHARSVIVTLFGDSVMPYGKEIWVGDLITLLAPFGINGRLVRTSLYRLSEAGWITAERRGRRSFYAPAPAGRHRFREAYRHVYGTAPAWRKGWTIVILAKGAATVDRATLKKELAWEGFSAVDGGVFLCPSDSSAGARETIHRLGLDQQVVMFTAHADDKISNALIALVQSSWSTQPANAAYADFLDCFQPLLTHLRRDPPTPAQSFILQTLMIDAFRRAVMKDPRLPSALLSKQWCGHDARALCRDIYQALHVATGTHIRSVLNMDQRRPTPTVVTRRFGGLDTPSPVRRGQPRATVQERAEAI